MDPLPTAGAPSLPPSVRPRAGRGGLPRLLVANDHCSGEVYLHGGQVTGWTPAGAAPVLWLSREAVFQDGKGIRGGIPVCAPWFGPGRGGDRTPMHGFVRTVPWRLVGADESDLGTTIRLAVTSAECPSAPTGYEGATFELAATFGAALEVALTVRAGQGPADLEGALHSYLVVGDVRAARVEGLDGSPYLDKTTSTHGVQTGPLTVAAETDRVFTSAAPAVLVDPVLGRRITVTGSGSADVVVWNPWAVKAVEMPDFADDDYLGMLCVETALTFDHHVTLAPGTAYRLATRLEVTPL